MGKTPFVHREMFERVNFLFQAARLSLEQDPSNLHLCRYYIQTMRLVAEKHVIRLHPHLKRTFCKQCNMLLVPGLTSRVRYRSQSEKHTVISCLQCGTIKRYMWRKGYNLWLHNPDAWLPQRTTQNKSSNQTQKVQNEVSSTQQQKTTLNVDNPDAQQTIKNLISPDHQHKATQNKGSLENPNSTTCSDVP